MGGRCFGQRVHFVALKLHAMKNPERAWKGFAGERMQLSGEQDVRRWLNNLDKLAANGQLERMLIERGKRRRVGVPFTWQD
jgi:hypothetical protein